MWLISFISYIIVNCQLLDIYVCITLENYIKIVVWREKSNNTQNENFYKIFKVLLLLEIRKNLNFFSSLNCCDIELHSDIFVPQNFKVTYPLIIHDWTDFLSLRHIFIIASYILEVGKYFASKRKKFTTSFLNWRQTKILRSFWSSAD